MIDGIRDEASLGALNLPRRTVIRLGALLAKGLSFTEAVLESAGRGTPGEKLILDSALLDSASNLDSVMLERLAAAAGVTDKLAIVEGSAGRVVALAEELLAQQAFGQAGSGAVAPLAELARRSSAELLAPAGAGASRARAELFPPEEIERLKLAALTSARSDEAVSALRRLACAPIPPEARGEVFVRALASPEAAVRAEAGRLLAGVGLDAAVSGALAELAAGDVQEKRVAIDRLGRRLAERAANSLGSADLELIAVLMGMTAALGAERAPEMRARVLTNLSGAAGILANYPERVAEVLRHSLDLVISGARAGASAASDFLGALGRHQPGMLAGLLTAELERTTDSRARVFLLAGLASLSRSAPAASAPAGVAGRLAAELAGGACGEAEVQSLAGDLLSLPAPDAARSVLEAFGRAPAGTQRHFLRMLADLCRFREVPAELVERAGAACLEGIRSSRKELRLAVFETLLPADPRLSAGLRADLARAYMDNFSDLVFRADIDLAETTLSRMGRPALAVLVERLAPAWPATDRQRACRVIGEIAAAHARSDAPDSALAEELTAAERRLLELGLGGFPDARELAQALGKLAGALGADCAALSVAWRRISDMKLPAFARLEAQSHIAAGRSATIEMVEESARGLLEALSAPEPASLGSALSVSPGTGAALELPADAADYVGSLPVLIRALVRVASAPRATLAVNRRILAAMTNRWKEIVEGRRLWGPAAAVSMIEGLRDLAMGPTVGASERLSVIRALGLKLADPPAMRAISEVLAADDSTKELAAPAASAALALLGLRDKNGRIPEEDRPEILAALARIMGRSALETGTPRSARLRERISAELLEGLKDEVAGVHDMITLLVKRPGLPEPIRKELSERLASSRAIVARPAR